MNRAVRVTDHEIHDAWALMGRLEGIFAAPEGAATWAGLTKLVLAGTVRSSERIVLFNTGTGLKYAESFSGELS